jgi:hypothetical protein
MSYADEHPGYRITSEAEARNYVVELVAGVKDARAVCDVQPSADLTRKAWVLWMTRHGAALGALTALHRVGKLGDVAYNELRQQVMATMAPTIIEGGPRVG